MTRTRFANPYPATPRQRLLRGAGCGLLAGTGLILGGFVLAMVGGWGPCGPAGILAEIGGVLSGLTSACVLGPFRWPLHLAIEIGLCTLLGALFLQPKNSAYDEILSRGWRRQGRI